MISVLIVGDGNVANHLNEAFGKVDEIQLTKINSRKLENIPSTDITILAVSDDAIAEVSKKINNDFLVHTSGACSIDELQNKNSKGVFYMLQTFTKNKPVNFSKVPFCLEANNTKNYKLLEKLASLIGKNIYKIDSNQREKLHVAAVFVNNFTNYMYSIGNDICEKHQIPFEILYPLIEETSEKIKSLAPKDAQTGPAIRKDHQTIKNHLNLLDNNQKEIYQLLTKSIQNGA